MRVGEKNVSLSLASVSARKILGWRNQTKPNQTEPNERKRGAERRGAARRRLLSISGHRYTSRPAARAYGIRTSAPTDDVRRRERGTAGQPASRPVTSIVFGSTARYIVAPTHESPISTARGPSIGSLLHARFLVNSSLDRRLFRTDRQSCPCISRAFTVLLQR